MIIVFEGIDGSGKSRHARSTQKRLINLGQSCQLSGAQKHTSLRRIINQNFRQGDHFSNGSVVHQLFEAIIIRDSFPNVEKYSTSATHHLILDRFIETLISYRPYIASKQELAMYANILESIFCDFSKRITIFLNASYETIQSRIMERPNITNSDLKALDQFEQINSNYSAILKLRNNKAASISTEQSFMQTSNDLNAALLEMGLSI